MQATGSEATVGVDRGTGPADEVSGEQLTGRDRILAVARAAFVERGYADVSMQEIANAAGLTKAAIYYHFQDKDALFLAVVVGEVHRLSQGIARELELGPPFQAQLERVARFAFASGRGDFGRLIDDAHRYCHRERMGEIRGDIAELYGMIREAFLRARDRGEIRDVNIDVALAWFFSMVGSHLKAGGGMGLTPALPPEELARMVAEMMLHGIGSGDSER